MPNNSPLTSPSASYLPALTGIRAVAAYLVFLHHFNPFDDSHPLLHYILLEFHIGVPIFFVLSGFLITLRYAENIRFTGRWWGQYLRNRFARIYPLFFLITCFNFAWPYYQEGTFDLTTFLTNIFLVRGYFEHIIYSGIPQGWTLTVEECFYLLAPVVFWLLARRRIRLWVIPFGLLAIGCLLVGACQNVNFYGLFANLKFMLLFTFFGRCFEFFAGMQLAIWFRQGRLKHFRIVGILTGTGILLIAAVLAGMVWTKGEYAYGQEHPFGVSLNNVALPGAIVMLFAGLLTEHTWLRQLLSSSLFQVLGKSSYVFYLIHMGVVEYLLSPYISIENQWLNLIVRFLMLNLLAIVLHYLVEQPLNKLIRKQPLASRSGMSSAQVS